jgi:hypothetical protein
MNPDADSALKTIETWNDRLAGLPGGTLTVVFVVVLALVLKWWRLFPNAHIPRWTTFLGFGVFCMVAPSMQEGDSVRIYIGRTIILGFVLSAVASMAALRFAPQLPVIGKFLSDRDKPPAEGGKQKEPNE